MKSLKLLFAVALVGLFALKANAQTDNAQANVSAVVQAQITFAKVAGDINFGTVTQGDSPVIDPTSLSGTQTAAEFSLDGADGASVDITGISRIQLSGGTGDPVYYTPSLLGDTDESNLSGASAIAEGNTVTLDNNTGSHGYYFWLGGSLTDGTNSTVGASQGTYTGTITLTATYN